MRIRALLTLVASVLLVPAGVRLGLGPGLRLLRDDRAWALRPPDDVLAGVLGLALAGASLVWATSLGLAVVEAALARRVPLPLPRVARGVAAGLIGAAAVAGPAHATTSPPDPLTGLPLPDRVATVPASQPVAPDARLVARVPTRTVEVRPGDSLWVIAERTLAPGARDADVDAAWRAIAATNHRVVPDPDLIFPGTELALPPLPHRKEHP